MTLRVAAVLLAAHSEKTPGVCVRGEVLGLRRQPARSEASRAIKSPQASTLKGAQSETFATVPCLSRCSCGVGMS